MDWKTGEKSFGPKKKLKKNLSKISLASLGLKGNERAWERVWGKMLSRPQLDAYFI